MPMIRFKQYLPGYFDPINIERREICVLTPEEFFADDIIARWASYPDFHRWSFSPQPGGYPPHLMAELDGGRRWRVVGYVLDGLKKLNLPEWSAPE